jgi:SAM-dependent methyltransferase
VVTANPSTDAAELGTTHPDLDRTLTDFFAEHSGRLLEVQRTCRRNSQAQSSGMGDSFHGVTAHVRFDNLALFGIEGDFLSEIYPRVRHLTSRLRERLNESGLPDIISAAAVMPYPNPLGRCGNTLPKEAHHSHGETIEPIAEVAEHNDHWRRVMERYDAEYVCITNNGTAVGPDISLLAAGHAIANTSDAPLRVYEFGSGTGTLATMLDRRGMLASYAGVDFGQEMVDHFMTRVSPSLSPSAGQGTVVYGSCMDAELPRQVDLMCVAVYYQAQPPLIKDRGREMARALGSSGILMAQTGMLEDPLVTALLCDAEGQVAHWPWYDPAFSLRTWFRCVEQVVIEEQVVVLASNDEQRLQAVVLDLTDGGHLQEHSSWPPR